MIVFTRLLVLALVNNDDNGDDDDDDDDDNDDDNDDDDNDDDDNDDDNDDDDDDNDDDDNDDIMEHFSIKADVDASNSASANLSVCDDVVWPWTIRSSV